MVAVPRHIFITSLAITIVVFIGGLLLGWYLDTLRSGAVFSDLRENELDAESYLLEQSFWETFGSDDCPFAEARLNAISVELAELGQDLNRYEKKQLFWEEEFSYLARRYFLLEVKGYLLYQDLKQRCAVTNTVILFYYSLDDQQSEIQGYVLDKVVARSNGTVDVFSFNVDFEGDTMIDTLERYYNVTTAPTIIINGEIKKEGYVSFEELKELLNATVL